MAAFSERMNGYRGFISSSQKFIFDNVANFYAEHEQSEWDIEEDIPNCAPPFQSFFVEWNEPESLMINGKRVDAGGPSQCGIFVFSVDLNKTGIGGLSEFMAAFSGSPGSSMIDVEGRLRMAVNKNPRWVLCCDLFMTSPRQPLCGHPLWMGIHHFIFVSESGQILDDLIGGVSSESVRALHGKSVLMSPIVVLGLGLSFCHCKNVSTREEEISKGDKWHRRTGSPKFTFKTLDINPMKKVLRNEGLSESTGIRKALHICRGHFARYTEESPLFGRYSGTFWRPDHVRGSAEHGAVDKDYRVNSVKKSNEEKA